MLADTYTNMWQVLRPAAEIDSMMWMMFVSSALYLLLFCYIFTKGYEGNRPHTSCRLTRSGRRRFIDYLAVLEQLVAVHLLADGSLTVGRYRLTFDTASYFRRQQVDAFYPSVTVEFEIADATQHYHVPLLLSPFGYSTYRGS